MRRNVPGLTTSRGPTGNRRRRRATTLRICGLGLAPALLLAGGVGMWSARSGPAPITDVVASSTVFTLNGHGHGHGRGMGQWGAYGYATKQGWTAEQIVSHFYGGTTLGSIGPQDITVRLMGQDGKPLDVESASPMTVDGRSVPPGQAVHLTPLPGGSANVTVTTGCAGAPVWTAVTTNPWVDPVNPGTDRPATEALKLCGSGTPYRGSLGVALDGQSPRTVNKVNIEDYLRSVVPSESMAAWADTGGLQALRAQAIAARSYAWAENRYPYAKTCDTQACQMYTGEAHEDKRTDPAVASTAGLVLMKDGKAVPAEFSSSTGGWTAGGEFPAVVDAGDAVSPTHNWTDTVTAGQIAQAFNVGELKSFTVTKTNGLGEDGGRVLAVKVVGTTGSVDASGDDARTKLKLKSDWFEVAGQPGPAPSATLPNLPGSATPSTPPPADGTDPIGAIVNAVLGAITGAKVDTAPTSGAGTDPNGTAQAGTAPAAAANALGGDPNSTNATIEQKYQELGGANGVLGKALGPTMTLPDKAGKLQGYTNGTIYWDAATGAHAVSGDVLRSWLSAGAEAGKLGYPISDPVAQGNAVVQKFQHGTLTFDKGTGKVTQG